MPKRSVIRTVLIVGEGKSEVAFLRYLKSIYHNRGCGVTVKIKDAHGKGPEHVVKYSIRQKRNAEYDLIMAFMDTDIRWTNALRKKAKTYKVNLVGTEPCFEGLVLKIANENVPEACVDCKARCKELYGDVLKDEDCYDRVLPRELLDAKCNEIDALGKLVRAFTGEF